MTKREKDAQQSIKSSQSSFPSSTNTSPQSASMTTPPNHELCPQCSFLHRMVSGRDAFEIVQKASAVGLLLLQLWEFWLSLKKNWHQEMQSGGLTGPQDMSKQNGPSEEKKLDTELEAG